MSHDDRGAIKKDSSFAKSLFLGNILEENLFPFPDFSSDEKETLDMVLESVDRFMADKDELFREIDTSNNLPESFLEEVKELGLFALIIPEEFGGIGLSNKGYSRVVQQTSRYDGSISVTLGAHSSIGMKGLLLFGNDQQKEKYLGELASGERIAAFCLTEPGSGSDAASIATSYKKREDGSFVLNGEKIWITNGPIARFFTVFARGENESLSAFIVEAEYSGLSTGPKEDKMGIRGSVTTSVIFQDVVVPPENLLGEEGQGFKIAMTILNNGRTGLGGGSVGAMKRCIELASRQAQDRKQFGKSIAEYDLIQEKIAQMTVDCYAAESAVTMIGHYIDAGVEDYSVEAAITKVFCSEALWRASNEALQVAGGNGFMREYPYERMVRDCRINLIFEGTNEILRLFIALAGLKEAGRYLKEIGSAASGLFNNPLQGFGMMSEYASKRLSQLTSIGGERLEVSATLRDTARIYELATLGLSREVERALRTYGKDVVNRQFLLKRLADVAIDIFVGFSMISRVARRLENHTAEEVKTELSILHVFAQQSKQRMKSNLRKTERDEDGLMQEIARSVYAQDGYSFDTL